MLKEYRSAILIKFNAEVEADKRVGRSILRYKFDSEAPKKLKEKALKFLSDWDKEKKKIHLTMLELEKAAFNAGYTFALGFTSGSCSLCEECNVNEGDCVYPSMARFPEHAVGVNIKKTVEKVNMSVSFPFNNKPEPIVLLLID
jgi:predicted metal-binding protein